MSAYITNTNLSQNAFDYIVTGAGCAGLSLLMRMMKDPFFLKKKVLVVDEFPKDKNDRTWCFWEKGDGLFEPIVHKKWAQLDFYSNSFSANFNIAPYEYKMIRGIDFYNYVISEAAKHSNIHFHFAKVSSVGNEAGKAFAVIEGKKVYAEYIFNSVLFNREAISLSSPRAKSIYLLLQHFKGWLIETEQDIFDDTKATFMDFRISQQQGTAFVYVLPVSARKALVEYTLFTGTLLPQGEYDAMLKTYINTHITTNDYTVMEEEYGIIPMTNIPFSKQDKRIINLGTAGGQTKASSGFTFQFIQKHAQQIIEELVKQKGIQIKSSFAEKKFRLYDSILLNVLTKNKMGGDKVFAALFQKNPPQNILAFLDNETDLMQDLKIISSVPTRIFMPVALKELLNTIKG